MRLYEYQRSRSFIDLGPNHSDSIFLNFFSSIANWSKNRMKNWCLFDLSGPRQLVSEDPFRFRCLSSAQYRYIANLVKYITCNMIFKRNIQILNDRRSTSVPYFRSKNRTLLIYMILRLVFALISLKFLYFCDSKY